MGGKFVEITGQRFGKLVVLGLDGERCNRTRWKCQCECGTVVSVLNFALKRGTTTTCGSARRQGLLYSTAYYRKVIRGNAPSRNVATRAPNLIWETEE